MGYTHYWERPAGKDIDKKTWAEFARAAKTVIASATADGIALVREYTELDHEPEVSDEIVCFNGAGGEGHETFVIPRKCPEQRRPRAKEPEHFAFCKTARKPYDAAVTSILVLARDILGFNISSDGGEKAFEDAPYKARA